MTRECVDVDHSREIAPHTCGDTPRGLPMEPAPSALDRLLALGSPELLELFLGTLDAPTLICRASLVCKAWAAAAEPALRDRCARQGWAPPRSSRLAIKTPFKWRAVYISRACRACLRNPGEFAARRQPHAAPSLLLCRRCAKAAPVVDQLRARGMGLDVTSLQGKPLFTAKQSRFCSDVSRLSESSLHHANCERAERQRRKRKH